MPFIVNLVMPLFLMSCLLIGASVLNCIFRNRAISISLAYASCMVVPYIISGNLGLNVVQAYKIYLICFLILACLVLITKKFRHNIHSHWKILSKSQLFDLALLILLAAVALMPALFSQGLFLPNANFDFIYQAVDAHYLADHSATSFQTNHSISSDLPLDWSAHIYGRYLSSVPQSFVSSYFFGGNYLKGSISVFIFFFLSLILSLYLLFEALFHNRKYAALGAIASFFSIYCWATIKYTLIGQVSSLPLLIFILPVFWTQVKEGFTDRRGMIALCFLVGSLCLIYFSLGFFLVSIIGLTILFNKKLYTYSQIFKIFISIFLGVSLVYFSPYFMQGDLALKVVSGWLDVIFDRMSSSGFKDTIMVEYLSELIGFRLLGLDLSPWLREFSSLEIFVYFPLFAASFLLPTLISYYLIICEKSKVKIIGPLWFTQIIFTLIFFATQGGYLVFKTVTYLFFVIFVALFFILKEYNSRQVKFFIAYIFCNVFIVNVYAVKFLDTEYTQDILGSKLTQSVGGSRDFLELIDYLSSKHLDLRKWLALDNPSQQAYVLLGSKNYRDSGIKNNNQILANARWDDSACTHPDVMPNDLIVTSSKFSPIADGVGRSSYSAPLLENGHYAVAPFKNINSLIVFSRGFYGPEPFSYADGNMHSIGRWSTGKASIVLYSKEDIKTISFKHTSYSGTNLIVSDGLTKNKLYSKDIIPGSNDPINLDINVKMSKGWHCITIESRDPILQKPLNRFIFKKINEDPRPIKLLISDFSFKN